MANPEAAEYRLGVKEMLPEDRPRERLLKLGAPSLSNHELLAILLGSGTTRFNVLQVAQTLLFRFRGLAGLSRTPVEELCQVPGIGPARAAELKACLELGKRLLTAPDADRPVIHAPDDAARLLIDMGLLDKEAVRVLVLNTKHHVVVTDEPYLGNASSSPIKIGELFKEAVRRNCPSIIIAHNHPSGDPAPSKDDIHVTREAVSAGKTLEIEVLDHIIIGRADRWISMKQRGLGFD